jgi:hypothetical protein
MQLTTKARNMNWLIGKNSQLSMANKLLIYKTILKPIWTYGIELWGCSKPSNTKVLPTFQSKMLRSITKAPWFVSNQTLRADLEYRLSMRSSTNKPSNTEIASWTTTTISYTNSPSNPW